MVAEADLMRGARSTLIMLAVFLGLAAYVYYVELERLPASETPPNEQVFDIESDAIDALTISAGGQETALAKSESGDWELTTPVQASADATAVSSITSRLASLEVNRVVSDEPMELEPFGLSAPSVQVSFRTGDGSVDDRLLIGTTTPTGADRYAKLASSDQIIMVASDLESAFRKTPFDLRDKTILDIDALDVDHLEVVVDSTTIAFDKGDGDWRMVDPWEVRADFSTVQGLIGRLSSGQMRAVVSEDPASDGDGGEGDDTYGLSDPAGVVTVRAGSATASLRLGDEAPGGARYAQDASRALVFTIDESLGTDIEREAGEYRDKNLFGFRPFNARRLEVVKSDVTTAFEKTETEPTDDAEDDGVEEVWRSIEPKAADVERSAMDDLLSALSNVRAESFADSRSDLGLDGAKLLATVTVQYEDSAADDGAAPLEDRVRLWRTGDDTYAIHGPEPGAAFVDTQSIDDALEALDAVIAGQAGQAVQSGSDEESADSQPQG